MKNTHLDIHYDCLCFECGFYWIGDNHHGNCAWCDSHVLVVDDRDEAEREREIEEV